MEVKPYLWCARAILRLSKNGAFSELPLLHPTTPMLGPINPLLEVLATGL